MSIEHFRFLGYELLNIDRLEMLQCFAPIYESFKLNKYIGCFQSSNNLNRLIVFLIDDRDAISSYKEEIPSKKFISVLCSSKVSCFELDPFNHFRLVIGLNNCEILVWDLLETIQSLDFHASESTESLIPAIETYFRFKHDLDSSPSSFTSNLTWLQLHPMISNVVLSSISGKILIQSWKDGDNQELILSHECSYQATSKNILVAQTNRFLNFGIYLALIDEDSLVVLDLVENIKFSVKLLEKGRNYRICWVLQDQFVSVSTLSNSTVLMDNVCCLKQIMNWMTLLQY
ncbi:hypothetical protein QR98_0043410 [Sarcoptes scabiei]|uniref:Uncharacterized protein n=1 Tax=Sarcoptes scabiei TaxID=52283 RepID=A0A132A4Q7_SARSC|nr:hypothetical protein QR98_0043410 [Sarcoptes scabiei]